MYKLGGDELAWPLVPRSNEALRHCREDQGCHSVEEHAKASIP